MSSSDDAGLLSGFLTGTLPGFPHEDHIRVAWLLIRRFGVDEAVDRMTDGIRAMAVANRHPEAFHATRTIAWMRLVSAASHETVAVDSAEFVASRPELQDRRALDAHYSPETLHGDAARRGWVPPDREPLP